MNLKIRKGTGLPHVDELVQVLSLLGNRTAPVMARLLARKAYWTTHMEQRAICSNFHPP